MTTIIDKVKQSQWIIKEALQRYSKIAIFVSFGKDSMVVLDLARKIDPDIEVISVMTKFKARETFTYKEYMTEKWNLNIETFMSDVDVSPDLAKTNPDECCRLLKVEPTRRALAKLDAWITGLRRTEGRTRTDYREVEPGKLHLPGEGQINILKDIVKINPILDWTEVDIWKYMAIHQIPPHPWYALGYRSIGCALCTHLTDDEDTERAGRWVGTSKQGGECGIHTMGGHV